MNAGRLGVQVDPHEPVVTEKLTSVVYVHTMKRRR